MCSGVSSILLSGTIKHLCWDFEGIADEYPPKLFSVDDCWAPHIGSKGSPNTRRAVLENKTRGRMWQGRVKPRGAHLEYVWRWLPCSHFRIRRPTNYMVEEAEELFVVLSFHLKSFSWT